MLWTPQTKPPPGASVDWGHPLARGLVGDWSCLEGAGSATQDLANSVVCPLNGATWKGPSILCDATSEYIFCGDATVLNLGRLTFAMKFRRSAWTTHAVLASHRTAAAIGHFFLFALATATPAYALQFDDMIGGVQHRWNTAYAPPQDDWTHVVITWDGVTKKLYVNGALGNSAAGAVSGDLSPSGLSLYLGRDSLAAQYTLNGEIEFARMWDRALTPAEIAWLHAEPYAMIQAPVWRHIFDVKAGSRRSQQGLGR